MTIKREGWLVLIFVVLLFIVVTVLTPFTAYTDPLDLAVRLCALYGFVALAIATIMTPFLKELTQAFGRSFLRIHHLLAILGIVFVTLHPVFFAISRMNILVFLPRFDSWIIFWNLAGRPALYLLYIATAAALLRRTMPKYWRSFHALMYVVLFFAIVHGNLIGTDFNNLVLLLIFNTLFILAIGAFVLKRYRNYKRRKTRQSS
jgi:DMSO/TMAO reductase YedYZ heme-binding membrane subunit